MTTPTSYLFKLLNLASGEYYRFSESALIGLQMRVEVNRPGWAKLTFRRDHPILSQLSFLDLLQVRRSPTTGADFNLELEALFQDPDYQGLNPSSFRGTFVGVLSMLEWSIVAWYPDTDLRSSFTNDPYETILYNLGYYNVGAGALESNGRIMDGPAYCSSKITFPASSGGGNSLDWKCAYDNVLETMQAMSENGGGDFNLVPTGDYAWDFTFYEGQQGTDRSDDLRISAHQNLMTDLKFTRINSTERTVALVGGPGEGSLRVLSESYGDNYSASSHHREMFLNLSNIQETDARSSKASVELQKRRAQANFSFKLRQTPNVLYGRDYFLGDLISCVNPYLGTTGVYKVKAVDLNWISGKTNEDVIVSLEEVP